MQGLIVIVRTICVAVKSGGSSGGTPSYYLAYGKRTNCPMIIERRRYSDDSSNTSPIKGKLAIITGGARGIGYYIADSLLAAGAQTIILADVLVEACEKATSKLNEKHGENKALFQPCDVTKKEDIEKIFKATKDKLGQLDIVVNNAGILADSKWEQAIAINAAGVVRGTLLGLQYMSSENGGNGGHIINVASILGLQPLYCTPVYVGTKHFVIGFTRSMGSEYFFKMTKVKVMAVCPGVTDTDMIQDCRKGAMEGFGNLGKELACNLKALPSQKAGKVGETVVQMIKSEDNGSVWVSEGDQIYKAELPDRRSFKPDPCRKKNICVKPDLCKKDPCCK